MFDTYLSTSVLPDLSKTCQNMDLTKVILEKIICVRQALSRIVKACLIWNFYINLYLIRSR